MKGLTWFGAAGVLLGAGLQFTGFTHAAGGWLLAGAGALCWIVGMREELPALVFTLGVWEPLHVACRHTYQVARRSRNILAIGVERLGTDRSPDGILDYIATFYGVHHIQMRGRRPPSRILEEIEANDLRYGHFTAGATRLQREHVEYRDLRVRRTDRWRLNREIRNRG